LVLESEADTAFTSVKYRLLRAVVMYSAVPVKSVLPYVPNTN
jgi:hypothetical protein